MSPITTHVLDASSGLPAAGIPITLEFLETATWSWVALSRGETGADGRFLDLLPGDHTFEGGAYRLRFDTSQLSHFYPEVTVQFRVIDTRQHYHVPLVFSPFGYNTYRGS